MTQVLDQHHDVLLCSQCQKYLSVFPIKVYEDRSVKCGRCAVDNDDGVVSLYQELAKNCLFKCINRYDGCRKLLHPSVVAEHELNCRGRMYHCFKCGQNPQMTACQLIEHFKQSHQKFLLKTNVLYFKISDRNINDAYLYIQDDNLFLVRLRYSLTSHDLYLSAVTFYELEGVHLQFTISVDSIGFKLLTKKQKCVSVGNAVRILRINTDYYCKVNVANIYNRKVRCEILLDMSDSPVCSTEIQLPKPIKELNNITVTDHDMAEPQTSRAELMPEFYDHFPDYSLTRSGTALYSNAKKKKIELTCSNCKKMLAEKVFICNSRSHLLCWDCSVWCSLCEYSNTALPEEVIAINKYLLFSCKWKCGTKCRLDDLEVHEMYCHLYKRECPICHTIIEGDLSYHMTSEHNCLLNVFFNLTDFLKKYENTPKVEEYFRMNNHIFKIECKRNVLLKKSVTTEPNENFVYNLRITPCDNSEGLELFVNVGESCYKLENGEVTVSIEDEPQIFLKYFQ